MDKIKEMLKKHKDIITYVFFGVLTTLVNFIAFAISTRIIGEEFYLFNNAIAWVVGVVFAYITNKLFVFESKSWEFKIVIKESVEFFIARLFSFGVEELGMWIFVDLLHFDSHSINIFSFNIGGQMIAKVILAVIVVIINYLFSKFVIFAKKKKPQEDETTQDTK